MHELMACAASLIIITMFIFQTAANTNTFIEAAYCEKTVSAYTEEECPEEEIPQRMEELKAELEKMPGIRAEFNGGELDLIIDGVIGTPKALGISDNSIHIKRKLEFKVKAAEDEEPDYSSGDPYDAYASFEDPDGDDIDSDLHDMTAGDDTGQDQ